MARNRTLNLDDQGVEDYLGEVKVNGKSYQVLAPTSLGLVGMARIKGLQKRMEAAQVAVSENEEDEVALAIIEACLDKLILTMLEGITLAEIKTPVINMVRKMRLADFVSGLLTVESETTQPETVALVEATAEASLSS